MSALFLELKDLSLSLDGRILLNGISLQMKRGELWTIYGPSGSGKTILAKALAGKNSYSGIMEFHWALRGSQGRVALVEQQSRFKNLSNTNEFYYQQRFNSYDSQEAETVGEVIGITTSKWISLLHVEDLLDKTLIQLSDGESKRLQIARALLDDPEFIILDNPFIGLDEEGRATLSNILENISNSGVQVLLFISGYSIPDCSTHSALLEGGRINTGLFNSPLIRPPSLFSGDLLKLLIPEKMVDFKRAIQMNKVNVRYGDKIILHDIDWIVLKGERWNLSGPNGAGKSTLLSLVTADNPQAYANDIYLFDWRRGSGESIWDIKKRIGFVSPELHLYFDFSANCYEVVASGLFDTIGLFRHLNNAQEEIVRTWMKLFNLEAYHGDTLSQLSISIQRVALLARALIKNPPLLILDEPCQGLDEEQTEYFKNLIDQICESFGTTLVYVSHYPQQVPSCVNQCLRLDCGRIVL